MTRGAETRTRCSLAVLAALVATLTRADAANDEYLVRYGRETGITTFCPAGHADLEALRRRFDTAHPGVKGPGYRREELMRMLRAVGGVLIEYRGRRYHSSYLRSSRNWPAVEEPIYAEATFAEPYPGWGNVYVLHHIWKGQRRIDGVFSPWETTVPALACR